MSDEEFMRVAIAKTREGIAAGQSPFGAVIVLAGAVVFAAHNTVWRDCDPSAHAEVNAIRQASHALRTIDLHGCIIYATCEPCPMCLTAIHWSKIDRVIYGATIADAASAGFSELRVGAEVLTRMGGSPLRVEQGPLRDECAALFEEWKQNNGRAY